MREVPVPPHITILFVEQEVKFTTSSPATRLHGLADCWRRHPRLGFGAQG